MANVITRRGELLFVHPGASCKAHRSRIGSDVFHNLTAAISIVGFHNQRMQFKRYRIAVREGHFVIVET